MTRLDKVFIPLFLTLSASCYGQTPLVCVAFAGTNTPVRVEGLAETVGDIVLQCTGGVPTAAGAPVPTVGIQIFLNTQITSRCLESATSVNCLGMRTEALLLLDEPSPATQYGCPTSSCANVGTGTGTDGYGPGAAGTPGNNKNVFQGVQTATNAVTFFGIPIDPPGTSPNVRYIRITNLRANANLLGEASGNSAPPSVVAQIGPAPGFVLPIILGPTTQAVGSVQRGAGVSVNSPVVFEQGVPQNAALAADPNSSGVSQFSVQFRELFGNAFKKRNIATSAANPGALANEDNLAQFGTFNTETNFYNPSLTLPFHLRPAGLADAGTRLTVRFFQIPAGVSLFAKVSGIDLYGAPDVLRMVSTDVNGAGPYSPVAGNAFGIAPLAVVNGAATAVYEIVESSPLTLANFDIPIYVAYTSNPSLGTAVVDLGYGPLSTVDTASGADAVPRFTSASAYQNAFGIQPALCTTLGNSTASFPAEGGSGSATVTAGPSCQWHPFTLDNWITVAPSGVTSGNGTVNYTVAENADLSPRSGIIFLNPGVHLTTTEYLTVNQAGLTCTFTLGPAPAPFVSAGGTGSVTVTGNSNQCVRTAVSNASWITVTSGNTGNGSGTVGYTVTLNPSVARSGTITIAGQTFTISQQGHGQNTPSPVLLSTPSGGGYTQTFAFTFSDPDGWQDLGILNVLINTFLDGRQGCYVAFAANSATSGTVYLVDNAGNAGGPFESLALPGGGTVANSQCTIQGTGSSVAAAGNTLTLTLRITFGFGFAGNKIINMAARDAAFHNSGWHSLGVWNVPGPEPTGPAVTGVNPARADTPTQAYTFTFTDTAGYLDLSVLNVLVNQFLDGRNGCYVAYVRSTGMVHLVNDNGDAGGPFASMAIGGSGTVENSQCSISGLGSSVAASGTTLTLTLPITFKPGFAGSKVIYAAGRSDTLSSGWQAAGSVTVP